MSVRHSLILYNKNIIIFVTKVVNNLKKNKMKTSKLPINTNAGGKSLLLKKVKKGNPMGGTTPECLAMGGVKSKLTSLISK